MEKAQSAAFCKLILRYNYPDQDVFLVMAGIRNDPDQHLLRHTGTTPTNPDPLYRERESEEDG